MQLSTAIVQHSAINMGLTNIYAGQPRAALAEFNKAADTSVDAAFDRAHCLLAMGNWKEGLADIEVRRLHKPDNYQRKSMPEWQGVGKAIDRLWVTTEQGIGDSFHFARFLPWASQ